MAAWTKPWSVSSYNQARTCLRQWYYDKIRKILTADTVPQAFGKRIHTNYEEFFRREDHDKGNWKKGDQRHYDLEKFVDACAGNWIGLVVGYTVYGETFKKKKLKPLQFRYDEGKFTPQELRSLQKKLKRIETHKGVDKSILTQKEKDRQSVIWPEIRGWEAKMRELAVLIFKHYDGQPMPEFVEWHTPYVRFEDHSRGIYQTWHGWLDELRSGHNGRPIIRDHKSYAKPMSPSTLERDPQFTMYDAMVSKAMSIDTSLARKLKVSEADIRDLRDNPHHMMDKFVNQYNWLETGFVKNRARRRAILPAAPRNEARLLEILEETQELKERIEREDWKAEEGYHCNSCSFQNICVKETKPKRVTGALFDHEVTKPKQVPKKKISKESSITKRKNQGQQKLGFMKPIRKKTEKKKKPRKK